MCFNCFEPGHTKDECPKLKIGHSPSDAKNDGKSSMQVHTVQRLPLKFAEFLEIVVSHLSNTHKYCMTQMMW